MSAAPPWKLGRAGAAGEIQCFLPFSVGDQRSTGELLFGNEICVCWWFGCHFLFSHILGC